MLQGTQEAVRLTMRLVAVYALWSGVLRVMRDAGVDKRLNRRLAPVTRKMFAGESEEARAHVVMNFTANLLGMGGVATSSGIQAIREMDRGGERITPAMTLFYMVNVTSIQLLPTTVLGLRSDAGSQTPTDILLPSFLATAFTTLLGVSAVLLIEKGRLFARKKGWKGVKTQGGKNACKRGKVA